MKIYDGSTWQDAKSLKIHNGSSWLTAVKGWIYNGSWQLAYPNSPVSTGGPTFTYSGTTYAGVGSTFTANSSWNMDPAYAPTSYTYQWKRGSLNISGATSQTYTATASDVDQVLGVTITATNARGSTTITGSSGLTILPILTSMGAYDSTATPSAPSVSMSVSNLSYSGSWGTGANATLYTISTNNGSVTPTSATSSGSYSGSGSAGSVTVTVTPTNTNKQVYIYWTAPPGAVSYDVVKYGNNQTTTINTTSTNYTWSIADGNGGNYFTVYPKTSAGSQGYGIQTSVTVSNKTGSAGSASGTLIAVAVPSGGSVSLSPSGTVQARNTITASTSFSTGSPTAYETQIRKATGTSPADENSGTQVAFSSSSSTSWVITDSEASGTPDQFAAFGRAYNAGGWSSWVKSNTVTSTPYVPPVTTYTITYNANGGSPSGSSTFTSGGINYAPTSPTRSGYTFNGWYDTGSLDYTYYVAPGGSWYPPDGNRTMYARWTAVATGSAPTITVSNSYDGLIGGKYQWTLTINNTSSTAATSYSWGIQFSTSNGGTVNASTTGSGGSIPAGGSVTVTRNDPTNTWARWVNVVASNAYGSSSTLSTGWA